MVLNFLVDLLLMMATNLLMGFPLKIKDLILAALIGGGYAGICILPGFSFLAKPLWHILIFLCMSCLGFGFSTNGLIRGCVFFLLSLALGGGVNLLGRGRVGDVLIASVGMCLVCGSILRGKQGKRYARIELIHKGKKVELLALLDTGNMLKDPITGQQVIVVAPAVANTLLGLTREHLNAPLATMIEYPGLRLIPYRSVGNGNGMLLGIHPEQIKINGKLESATVAFAPDGFGCGGVEGLVGGCV